MMEKEPLQVSDWSQKYKILLYLLGLVLLIVGYRDLRDVLVGPTQLGAGGNSISGTPVQTVASSSNILVTSTLRLVLANQSAAQLRCFGNASGSTPIYLGFGTSTGLMVGTGFPLMPSSSVTFAGDELDTGDIYAIAAVATNLSMCQR